MNPFLQQVLGTMVRTAIVWLAAKFGATLSDDELVQLTAQIAPVVAVVSWSLWQKYRGRQKLLTALASPTPATEAQIENLIALGNPPSVTTQKCEVPR